MFCAPNVRRTEKRRKNCCSGLENRGRGRPREARANKFGRQNGQVGQKSALEVPPGPPKIYKWARTKQLRARKRDQSPRGASGRLGIRAVFSESLNGFFFGFGWGALPPRPPQVLAGGAKPSETPPPKRSSAAFDRGGQTGPPRSNAFFFGAADDTGAADDRPAGRPAGRSAGRTSGRTPAVTPGRTSPQTLTKNPFHKS